MGGVPAPPGDDGIGNSWVLPLVVLPWVANVSAPDMKAGLAKIAIAPPDMERKPVS